jgi:hypothetical protein
MGIGDKIKAGRRNEAREESEKRLALERAIKNHPDREMSRRIIPVIEPILRELAGTANLIFVRDTTMAYGTYGGEGTPLIAYLFYEKLGSWIFAKKGMCVGYIRIGTLAGKDNVTTLRVVPLSVRVPGGGRYRMISHDKDYEISEIPESPGQMKEWLEKEMLIFYNGMKSVNPRQVR